MDSFVQRARRKVWETFQEEGHDKGMLALNELERQLPELERLNKVHPARFNTPLNRNMFKEPIAAPRPQGLRRKVYEDPAILKENARIMKEERNERDRIQTQIDAVRAQIQRNTLNTARLEKWAGLVFTYIDNLENVKTKNQERTDEIYKNLMNMYYRPQAKKSVQTLNVVEKYLENEAQMRKATFYYTFPEISKSLRTIINTADQEIVEARNEVTKLYREITFSSFQYGFQPLRRAIEIVRLATENSDRIESAVYVRNTIQSVVEMAMKMEGGFRKTRKQKKNSKGSRFHQR